MKKITLKKIHLINWKGAKDREVDFDDITTISGDNATGKSTIFDAFTWLLFGKDQFERKDHEITPVVDGVKMERIDSEVSAIIDVDGQETTLKRILHPKWVRRRGKSVEEFDGYDTKYYINDVPVKMSEYDSKIASVIDTTVFKMVTNPLYFFDMVKWQDQRAVLLNIAGTVTDAEIALKDERFAALLDKISGKSFEEYKTMISTRKKKLNADLKLIPAKIDQTRKLMPDVADWAGMEDQKKTIDAKIAAIDTEIADKVKANRQSYEDIRKIQKKISDLEIQRDGLVSDAEKAEAKRVRDHNAEEDVRVDNANADCRRLDNTIRNDRNELKDYEDLIQTNEDSIKRTEAERDRLCEERTNLLARWKEINGRTFTPGETCVTCPLFNKKCEDAAAAGRVEELNKKAEEKFIEKNRKDLEEVNARGTEIKKRIESLTQKIVNLQKAIDEAKANAETLKKKIAANELAVSKMEIITPVHIQANAIVPENVEGWKELNDKIQELKAANKEPENVDTTELQTRKGELMAERDDIVLKLQDKKKIEDFKKEIEKLEKESKDISQQIADIEKEEFTIADFNKVKIDECESRVSSMFTRVSWKMFDKTIKGDEYECCIPTNKEGVAISSTNTADIVNCGLDVINVLCKYYDVNAPIFIDNRESVSQIIKTESQIINLQMVKDQKELKIEHDKWF